jgi:hypothetical protein
MKRGTKFIPVAILTWSATQKLTFFHATRFRINPTYLRTFSNGFVLWLLQILKENCLRLPISLLLVQKAENYLILTYSIGCSMFFDQQSANIVFWYPIIGVHREIQLYIVKWTVVKGWKFLLKRSPFVSLSIAFSIANGNISSVVSSIEFNLIKYLSIYRKGTISSNEIHW